MPRHTPAAAPLFEGELTAAPPSSAIRLNAAGRLVDFLDAEKTRPDTPEERVRQEYVRTLVEEYGYPKELIALSVPISTGSTHTKEADIAVYLTPEARAHRRQGEIALIVETKAPDKTIGQNQLASYVFFTSTAGAVWTNGAEATYWRRMWKPQNHLRDWTNIPRYGESWDSVGHYTHGQLRPPRNLKQVFDRCHNAIYKAGSGSEMLAMDMVKVILAKYQDEMEAEGPDSLCAFRCTPEEAESEEGRAAVAQRVANLFAAVVESHPEVYNERDEIGIDPAPLATVVGELQPYRFVADYDDEQVYDVIGTAFEVYMADHLKGEKGQWFTNRLLVGAMVEMLAPTDKDVILDPACGPGGFLVACLRRVRHHIAQTTPSQVAQHAKFLKASKRVFGIDVAPHLVKVAKTNMILNGDGHGGIVRGNTLQSPVKLPPEFKLRPDAGRYNLRPTRIFANPPFGDNPELRVKDTEILTQFEVGHEWERGDGHWLRKTSRIVTGGVPPELLFLERCIDWLEPGGKLGIVIARGALDNVKALAARQYVLRHARLLGVIHAHPNTFKPFNGTKASVLLVEKKGHVGFEHDEDYPVFMAINQSIGQDSEGRDVYKRDKNGKVEVDADGVPVLDHDLDMIAHAWAQFEKGEEPDYEAAWTVPLSRITSTPEMRFNPTRYAPKAEAALSAVLEMAGSDEWEVEQIGDFATVFEGERFKRPYANKGVDSGEGVVRYYTPKAFFEARGESAKYLDWNKANATQERQLTELTLQTDWIVIANAGTAKKGALVGRVGLTTTEHAGSIGSNNLTRIVVEDPEKRAYLYRFLRSDLGHELLLRNVYGTNQDHVDLDDVKRIPIPFPKDKSRLHAITKRVEKVKSLRERAAVLDREAGEALDSVLKDVIKASTAESAEDALPFPDTDLSPTAQRTIQRMLDEGDDKGAADFLTQLGEASEPE
ncbi:MAG: N-6 DNA methylase [Rhodothermales bacterium]